MRQETFCTMIADRILVITVTYLADGSTVLPLLVPILCAYQVYRSKDGDETIVVTDLEENGGLDMRKCVATILEEARRVDKIDATRCHYYERNLDNLMQQVFHGEPLINEGHVRRTTTQELVETALAPCKLDRLSARTQSPKKEYAASVPPVTLDTGANNVRPEPQKTSSSSENNAPQNSNIDSRWGAQTEDTPQEVKPSPSPSSTTTVVPPVPSGSRTSPTPPIISLDQLEDFLSSPASTEDTPEGH